MHSITNIAIGLKYSVSDTLLTTSTCVQLSLQGYKFYIGISL